ncbi:hypothetical protein C7H19_07530 [Aphanothece hegewaldii CCALA 016]|uniref:DUF2828 domain-containing protein n=1 Tax=Aphanothece hegewaldii CCALA 016 TaxID=2107694 RepID=A0A2T1LZJ9_9CHRO|nr:DUF2828 family protein [Aphanothece hegewaldii]PSF37826.1 hypothetical protein C7H19_07530 [Aphanothece hegewaldii CCALA 016]
MNQFFQSLSTSNKALTQNNAVSHYSTLSPCLNFFAQGGSLRNQSPSYIHNLFSLAWQENPQLAIQIMAWIYDCRGGCGERDVFYYLFVWLANHHLETAKSNLFLIPEFGRWDMLIRLLDIPTLQESILALIRKQLNDDLSHMEKNLSISLCAKWLPREGKQNEDKAKLIQNKLNLSPKNYRRLLASLGQYIKIVEQKMCAQEWKTINYAQVPSRASMIYRHAFGKHDQTRYQQYLNDVAAGKAEIKAAQLYPYDIIRNYLNNQPEDLTLELQWKALPNPFDQGDLRAILPVVDVSGSMYTSNKIRPIDVSISLGIFFAEKNPSIWGGSFITFSGSPVFEQLKGKSLREKVNNLRRASWAMNTNIQAVFDLILNKAKQNGLSNSELPEMVLIISDMEFDQAQSGKTNYQAIDDKFKAAGYTRPVLVFWNVDAKSHQFPVTKNDDRVILLSGFSPNVFTSLMSGKIINPTEAMLATIDIEKYRRWQALSSYNPTQDSTSQDSTTKDSMIKSYSAHTKDLSKDEIKSIKQALQGTSQEAAEVTEKNVIKNRSTALKKVDFSKLKLGDYLFDIQYYKVVEVNPKSIAVINERGFGSEIDKDIIEEGMYSASQYEFEKIVSRTEICEILEQAGNYIFTVNFNKQIREKDLKDKLLAAIKDKKGNPLSHLEIEKALSKVSQEAIQGEERTLVGYLLKVEPKMGRSTVIDIECPVERNRIRLVDHRTINWLILRNVKYVVQ